MEAKFQLKSINLKSKLSKISLDWRLPTTAPPVDRHIGLVLKGVTVRSTMMARFLRQQNERLKRAFKQAFLPNYQSEQSQPIPPDSSAPTETKPSKVITFENEHHSNVGSVDANGAPKSLPEQPPKPVKNLEKAENNIKSKLSHYQAQFQKYLCSFKTRTYEWEHNTLLSKAEEAKAIRFTIELFACMTQFLGPALRDFLASKKLQPQNSVLDVYQYLKIMKDGCKKNRDFLAEGGGNGLHLQHVETAHKGRNCVCHGALPEVLKEWHVFLHSWIEILNIINAPAAAEGIQKVHDRLTSQENNPEILPTCDVMEMNDEKGDNQKPVGQDD